MTDRELMQQALEALEADDSKLWPSEKRTKAINALRERLAQPEKLPMVEIETVLTVQPEVQRTHWNGCEEVHPECRKPEREACARVCEDLIGTRAMARHCADAIRARS